MKIIASVALAKVFSACAQKNADWTAASAATTIAFVESAPGTKIPTIGAGKTE